MSRYINGSYGRTGALWEGRYKSTLVDEERYLLTLSRYIELNPFARGWCVVPGSIPGLPMTATQATRIST